MRQVRAIVSDRVYIASPTVQKEIVDQNFRAFSAVIVAEIFGR